MIFDSIFGKKKESFVLNLKGMDTSLKKYPINDMENNFFFEFSKRYPQYYPGLSMERMSNGVIKFSYRTYPIGGVSFHSKKPHIFVENDFRYKDPYKIIEDDLFNHYEDIINVIKRKCK